MVFNLYRCNGKVFLSNDIKMVDEHVNRGYSKRAPVKQMPIGSVILINNKPYDVNDLIRLSKKHIKDKKIDWDKPLSVIVDQNIVQ